MRVKSAVKENGKYFLVIAPEGLTPARLKEVTREEYHQAIKRMRRPKEILNLDKESIDEFWYDESIG